ncbi:hypothetical protein CS542_01570 [Pedobacter sp. IW39]|nr:hypothetical protein CS542_01570 [Pedobacter sp. IW39]
MVVIRVQVVLENLYRFDAINSTFGKKYNRFKENNRTGFNAVWTGLFEVNNKIYLPYYKFKHTLVAGLRR